MPALPFAAKVIKLDFRHHCLGIEWHNILHCKYSGAAGVQADYDALAASIGFDWGALHLAAASSLAIFDDLTITDLSGATGLEGFSGPMNIAGGGEAEISPAQVATVISWKVARHFRGGHSRTYLGGIPADKANAFGAMDPTYVAAVATEANEFLADVVTDLAMAPWTSGFLCNVSYYGPPTISGTTTRGPRSTVRATPLVDQITGAVVHPILGTQRRRLART